MRLAVSPAGRAALAWNAADSGTGRDRVDVAMQARAGATWVRLAPISPVRGEFLTIDSLTVNDDGNFVATVESFKVVGSATTTKYFVATTTAR